MGKQGKKDCPECKKETGARTRICSCGHLFISKIIEKEAIRAKNKEEKEEKKEQKKKEKPVSPLVQELLLIPMNNSTVKKTTPREHAERVLGYGREKTICLLEESKNRKCWSHVDWDYVKEQLEKKVS